MQVVGGLVYMQGQVNHSPPINVVLDSGALVPLTFVTGLDPNVRVDVNVPEGLFE